MASAEPSSFMPVIEMKGRYFWKGKDRFIIRGVVYQGYGPDFANEALDILADDHLEHLQKCVPLFTELGLNTLRVYQIYSSKSHDAAMALLKDAGIYVVAQLTTSHLSINRTSPYVSYTAQLMQSFFRTIDCLAKYDNVIGVVVTSGLINHASHSDTAEVVRAVVRDLKRYMAIKNQSGQRVMPLGVAQSAVGASTESMLKYFTAGHPDATVDFYAPCDYKPSITSSSQADECFGQHTALYSQVPIPMFISEYGGSFLTRPRKFDETTHLYSSDMLSTFSGGCVYEFLEGPNRWGIITMDREEGTLNKTAEFENYKQRLRETAKDVEAHEMLDTAQGNSNWRGSFPAVSEHWRAKPEIPTSPVDWQNES